MSKNSCHPNQMKTCIENTSLVALHVLTNDWFRRSLSLLISKTLTIIQLFLYKVTLSDLTSKLHLWFNTYHLRPLTSLSGFVSYCTIFACTSTLPNSSTSLSLYQFTATITSPHTILIDRRWCGGDHQPLPSITHPIPSNMHICLHMLLSISEKWWNHMVCN